MYINLLRELSLSFYLKRAVDGGKSVDRINRATPCHVGNATVKLTI